MALLDLADLAHDLMRHGVLREAIPYDAYGLTASETERLAGMLDGYPHSKIRRLAHDGESRIRQFLAYCVNTFTGK